MASFAFSGFFFSDLNIFQRLEEIPDKCLIAPNDRLGKEPHHWGATNVDPVFQEGDVIVEV
jgi:hypothetical protein